MPKIINNNGRVKSARKPLIDISNGGKSLKQQAKTKTMTKAKQPLQQKQEPEDNVLDRLLLEHSDLSKFIKQIDELVVQALEVKLKNKRGIEEIESFTNILSDMNSSLKCWVPRFQQSLAGPSVESENQVEQSSPIHTFPAVAEEISNAANSPQQFELSSRVSPSPLVTWCTERTVESGRQLFLLTPLSRSKKFSSKCPGSSRPFLDSSKMDDPFSTTFNISEITDDDLLEGIEMKPTPTKIFNPSLTFSISEITNNDLLESTPTKFHSFLTEIENLHVSPPKFTNRDRSTYLVTPRLKRSPPKSCILLEPIAEAFQQDYRDIPKSTPYHAGTQNCNTSEPSGNYITESLALKYPELFGRQYTQQQKTGRKEVEPPIHRHVSPPKSCLLMEPPYEKLLTRKKEIVAPLDFPISPPKSCVLMEPPPYGKMSTLRKEVETPLHRHISPPKSCVLMEPPYEKLSTNLTINANQSTSRQAAAADKDVREGSHTTTKTSNQGLLSASVTHLESIPVWNGSESILRTGKQPGENTLKRELWTRFQEASSNDWQFKVSVSQETSGKGFLDRLEEVSCEDMSSIPKGPR